MYNQSIANFRAYSLQTNQNQFSINASRHRAIIFLKKRDHFSNTKKKTEKRYTRMKSAGPARRLLIFNFIS